MNHDGTSSLYFYDLETSGTDPRWDRVVQFAGVRTDLELAVIGEPSVFHVQLPLDVLPDPAACAVTGITPQLTIERGVREDEAFARIDAAFSEPGTCALGYNSIRFDDEFVRFGLYRNLHDPYAREWRSRNSRWDLIDVARAQAALRPDGLRWPVDEEGLPVFRLESLTAANDLAHDAAHDAMSDVGATLALARLLRGKQPRLFAFAFGLRRKARVQDVLRRNAAFVHVSAMLPRRHGCTAPMMVLAPHPRNANAVLCADLSCDPTPLLDWPVERMREALFTPGVEERPGIKAIHVNRSPFVAPLSVLGPGDWQRLGLDRQRAADHRAALSSAADLTGRVTALYAEPPVTAVTDVDAALYAGFASDDDGDGCADSRAALADGCRPEARFEDGRFAELVLRFMARNRPELLSPEEQREWRAYVRRKLGGVVEGARTLAGYRAAVEALAATGTADGTVLRALAAHGDAVAAWLET